MIKSFCLQNRVWTKSSKLKNHQLVNVTDAMTSFLTVTIYEFHRLSFYGWWLTDYKIYHPVWTWNSYFEDSVHTPAVPVIPDLSFLCYVHVFHCIVILFSTCVFEHPFGIFCYSFTVSFSKILTAFKIDVVFHCVPCS